MAFSAPEANVRVRYPFRAILVVTLTGLLALFNLLVGSLFIMPMIPLIPVFIVLMIGNACLLGSALDYARSVARPRIVGMAAGELSKLPSAHAEIPRQAKGPTPQAAGSTSAA